VYRTAELLASGAIVAAGTDYPAADSGDPIVTLFSMVTRKGADGAPDGGWYPDQKASVADTLRAMTWAPAYAAFAEQDLGALAPGRFADFTALSADPTSTDPDRLRELHAQMTVVAGRVVFTSAAALAQP
jgi:predicted amidohydrolase YtcJ